MNVKIVHSENGQDVLQINGANKKLINALRRTIIAEVPTLAIEDLYIHKNDSFFFDEYIAARLALVPLKMSKPEAYKEGDKVKLVLKEKGPKEVKSGDIKSLDPNVEVYDKEITIAKLRENEELFIEMEASMGTGNEHYKWTPALVSYNEIPKLEGNPKSEELAKKIVSSCPKGLLEYKAGKIIMNKPYECNLCDNCVEASEGKLQIKLNGKDFYFRIESYGMMENKDILIKACDVLKEKFIKFEAEINKI